MKKVIIIGGGVSGIATAIYLQLNGYDTLVLEKNATLGGACIGWERKGCYIDGCIHWLVGTKPNTDMYRLWEEVGALSPDVEVFRQKEIHTIEFLDGKKLTVWADVEKLREELLAIAPEDKKAIEKFCKLIKRFAKINPPIEKPVDLMNVFELCKIGFTMVGDYYYVNKASKMSCTSYAENFKNPYVRKWLGEQMCAGYNLMSLLYMFAHIMADDGGIPIGGSFAFVERMAKRYLALGGEIRRGAEVERVDVENGVAVGVTMKNGEKMRADWVVASTPIEHTLKQLLDGKYAVKKMDERLNACADYPIYTYTTAVFKVNADMSAQPLSHRIYVNEPIVLDREYADMSYRNYAYDKTVKMPTGCSVMQATLAGDDEMYFWWKDVKARGEYQKTKKEIGEKLLAIYLAKYPHLEGKIEVIDVVTPMTYERYLNGRHGSFQGFVQTYKGKALMQKGEIKGLKNFMLSGQWLLRSGGLPPAVMVGRFTAQRICKRDKKKFKKHE
ncbi:MAG: NAD(P)/FAD-dependent oxidoreductase [Clostridiales bacterium]|nr:NAD(P)/FAD-dependent oxidoreductase [Clostridiales bacterium]